MALITKEFTSKRNPTRAPYRTELDTTTGAGSCDCNGFIYSRKQPRNCRHLDQMRQEALQTNGAAGSVRLKVGPQKDVPRAVLTRITDLLGARPYRVRHATQGAGDVVRIRIERYRSAVAWSKDGPIDLPAVLESALMELPDGVYDGVFASVRFQSRALLFDVVEGLGVALSDRPFSERQQILELAVAHHSRHCVGLPYVSVMDGR